MLDNAHASDSNVSLRDICFQRERSKKEEEKKTRTIFDRATLSFGTIRVMSKVALIAGSSQQGKARRASVAWRG